MGGRYGTGETERWTKRTGRGNNQSGRTVRFISVRVRSRTDIRGDRGDGVGGDCARDGAVCSGLSSEFLRLRGAGGRNFRVRRPGSGPGVTGVRGWGWGWGSAAPTARVPCPSSSSGPECGVVACSRVSCRA